MEWNQLVWYVPPAIGGLVIGHLIGMRHSRKASKRSLQKLNQQSLELLEARSMLLEYQAEPEKQTRRERLLQLALSKLQQANGEVRDLRQQRDKISKQHFIELSRMRLRAEEACETARKACGIAISATLKLDKLTRTSHDSADMTGEAAPLDLAERALHNGSSDSVSALLNRDPAELDMHHSDQKVSVR